ncbi:hypothetical protein DESAMIL20_1893 [Desulfurella amilsii]|uniref:Uncharacterized protein n=1 Tax=Desulfurella amilsii TaxID=1562698 RepID=A0A1X4XXS9_9BACT|nr:hypothetical protein [Desulfurella amilsii]OSS42340.1 hypothetical protein DESAMIL20_1893 [Desulfurella amilsii]
MIAKENLKTIICQKAQDLEVGQYLDIRSYKRNRSVLLVRLQDSYRLIENGFRKLDINLDFDGLKAILKIIERIEFPRSHTIRIYKMDNFDETKMNLKRKKL